MGSSIRDLPAGALCSLVAVSPSLVRIRFATSVEDVIVELSGCGRIITGAGETRYLSSTGDVLMSRYFHATVAGGRLR